MEQDCRFTILTFPQNFDGNKLKINIVLLPRNQNPLTPAIEGEEPRISNAKPFADANVSFVAKIISDLSSGLPVDNPSDEGIPLTVAKPENKRALFEILSNNNQFQIENKGTKNTNWNINHYPKKAPDPVEKDRSVKKYLPLSYRKSFNFVAPRTPNAVTDESYHCQVRKARKVQGFKQSPDEISWGQVFAYVMRQPLLAKAAGLIYETELEITKDYFPKGGWLYVDLAKDSSDYKNQQKQSDAFIKKYAARVPALKLGPEHARNVFAAIQFPVLPAPPAGNYDTIFIEAAEYDDGFGKIVHAFQPVSANLLLEEADGFHPTKEGGIRLGWDDEQILIWYMRQLAEDESVGTKKRIDAPMGVFGYRIDVRETNPVGPWQSLCAVRCKEDLKLVNPVPPPEQVVTFAKKDEEIELNYQVYPTQLDGDLTKNYWLPMYFANWNGKSMVLPDDEACEIYQNDQNRVNSTSKAPPHNLNKIYEPLPIAAVLRYGKTYQFRIRMSDLSGGGPQLSNDPIYESSSPEATCRFKRFVAPSTLRIAKITPNIDEKYFTEANIKIKRPLLGYPAAVFTGKYANAVALLKQASIDMVNKEAFGIADPDVDRVEITVELQTLKMDNLMSVSGREAYIKFYKTYRSFPKADPVFEDELVIPIEYRDCKILNFGDPADLGDLGVTQADIDSMNKLILPNARVIRLTIRAVCEENLGYYGLENENDSELNTRYGRTTQFLLYSPSSDETDLFAKTSLAEKIQGIYLQPDLPFVYDGNVHNMLLGKQVEKPPDMVQRLAQQLGLENSGLTLTGKKGQRIQFGCSNRVRHTLSPDNSSITFASKGDLMNHWLCGIKLQINRDWTWDALEGTSFMIHRKKRFREDPLVDTEITVVGDIEIKKTAPFNALINPKRDSTTIIFIDAVEPKNQLMQPAPNATDPRFPDLIELEYTVEAKFKPAHAAQKDDDLIMQLELPITLPPAQTPKIVSAGIALSPYQRNEKYSTTGPRRRFLWIEFEEPIRDSKDTYFARVLAYSPDQLLSNNDPELLLSPDEPSLPVDPEYIRVITHGQSNDLAGADAMQPLEKAVDPDNTHYLLPLPPALHSESPELFGFFTYEFRVGHYKYQDTTANHDKADNVWTTAQGRFGRALRATGVQHPAPTLTCTVNRDEEKLYVTAPYAVTVHKGRNVTADPPRTEIWCLLYAQVKQADNKDYRNILLDDRMLDWNIRVQYKPKPEATLNYTPEQKIAMKKAIIRNWNDKISIPNLSPAIEPSDVTAVNKDATKYGTTIWSNYEINQLLTLYGLPLNSPLSVLCVEILPQITNMYEHISNLKQKTTITTIKARLPSQNLPKNDSIETQIALRQAAEQTINLNEPKPLSDKLGQYRILRTSPLNEVPFVCIKDC
jgi:hypothetical protein